MTRTKAITGTYKDMIQQTGLPEVLCEPCKGNEAATTIDKDLTRGAYVGVRPMQDMHNRWHAPDVSQAYTQGNINASVFLAHWKDFILLSPGFEHGGRTDADRLKALGEQGDASTPLAFSYFDQNNLPCAVSICYSRTFPSLWTATIISDTTAEPDQRKVTMICGEEMLGEGVPTLWTTFALKQFRQALNSPTVSELLGNIVDRNGDANVEHLNALRHRIVANKNVDDRDNKEKLVLGLSAYVQEVMPQNNRVHELMAHVIKEWTTEPGFFGEEHFNAVVNEVHATFVMEIKKSNLSEEEKAFQIYNSNLFFNELKLENAATSYPKWQAKAILELKDTLSDLRLKANPPPLPYPELNYKSMFKEACEFRAVDMELQEGLRQIDTLLIKPLEMKDNKDSYDNEQLQQLMDLRYQSSESHYHSKPKPPQG